MEYQTQLTDQPVTQISDAPVTTPKSNHSLVIGFLIVAILLVAGSVFAGIQIGKNQQLQQQSVAVAPTEKLIPSTSQPSVSPTAAPAITNSPTTSTTTWKTYENTKLGIEFKYPSYLSESKNCKREDVCFSSKDLAYSLNELGEGGGYYYPKSGASFSFTSLSKTDEMKIDDSCNPGGPSSISSCKDALVGGFPAKIILLTLDDNAHEYSTQFTTLTDTDLFIFNQDYADANNKELLNGIIETVKFTK